MITNGFVKFPREIVNRSWFGDGATLTVYVFLLCGAAFKDIEREGYIIHKGQYVTSNRQLAEKCQLGVQQVKTALKHLKATHDITVEPSTKFSVITVNFDVDSDFTDPRVDPRVKPRVNPQTNPISRSIEENKEEIKEEYREEAAPPFTPCLEKEVSVEELTDRYGSAAVRQYEEKFRVWAEGKNTSKISMYPTIAKWLAQDIGQAAPERGQAMKHSSLDVDDIMRRVMERYKKNSG